jgi:hypothetical protein
MAACDRGASGESQPTDATAADASTTDASATDASASDAGASEDASGADARVPEEGGACIAADSAGDTCCVAGALRPLPASFASVVDLSDIASISIGTCGKYLFDETPHRRGYELPSDPAAYPLKLVLPAISGADPACEPVCNEFEPYTAFGIALEVSSDLIGFRAARGLAIFVPSPWKFVSGGCGEACPYPCLGGYQEFGIRSCTTLFFGDFGVATESASAPSVEVVIELIDAPAQPGAFGASSCCPYQ